MNVFNDKIQNIQNENDNLVGKHSSLAETMNDEVINLPESLEGMQLLLLQYREDLITAKVKNMNRFKN